MKKLLVRLLFLCASVSAYAENGKWVPLYHDLGNKLLFKSDSNQKYVSEEGPLVIKGDFFIPKLNDKFTAIVDLTQCYTGSGTMLIHDHRIKWTETGTQITDRIAQSLCDWEKLQPDEDEY